MKKVLTAFLAVVLFSTTTYASTFSDVDENTHYQTAINWMAENGIVQGYGDGTFGPDNCVNRAEMLKILFKTLEVDETQYSSETPFPDTKKDAWYTPYATAGKARGTVEGYTDGNFKPTKSVSRVEAIKMALLEFNNGEIPETAGMFVKPKDISEMSNTLWWQPYFESAYSANLIGEDHFEKIDTTGTELETHISYTFNFEPNSCMTRKEVSEMIYRMKAIKDNNKTFYETTLTPNDLIILDQEETITIETVREAFEQKYPETDYSNHTITIENNIDNEFIEGGISAPEEGGAHYWAAKIDGTWTIIARAQDSISCEVFTPYNFPQEMIENNCF